MKYLLLVVLMSSSFAMAMGSGKPEAPRVVSEVKGDKSLLPEHIEHESCIVFVLIEKEKLLNPLTAQENNMLLLKGYSPIQIASNEYDSKVKEGYLYLTLSHIDFPTFVYKDQYTNKVRFDYSRSHTNVGIGKREYNSTVKEFFERPLVNFTVDSEGLGYNWMSVFNSNRSTVSETLPPCVKK